MKVRDVFSNVFQLFSVRTFGMNCAISLSEKNSEQLIN